MQPQVRFTTHQVHCSLSLSCYSQSDSDSDDECQLRRQYERLLETKSADSLQTDAAERKPKRGMTPINHLASPDHNRD